MPAHGLIFVLYILLSVIIFPITTINFLIVNSPLLPSIKSFVVTTSSMDPIIPQGSLIYTLKEPSYNKGDIITFIDSVGKVTHRIKDTVVVGGTLYYLTQGDANSSSDNELVLGSSIYGKTVAVIPYLGNGVLFFKTQYGLIFGAVLPALFLLLFFKRLTFMR